MLRAFSVSANLMVSKIKTGSGNINKMHSHSGFENDGGQLSNQNGSETAMQTPSQAIERIANKRVLGLPID